MLANILRSQCKLSLSLCRISISRPVVSRALYRLAARPVLVSKSPFLSAIPSRSFHDEGSEPTTTLFIANISWDTSEADLSKLFSLFGPVKAAQIGIRADGQSRGIGWVTFENIQDAMKAHATLETEEVVLHNRSLQGNYSTKNITPRSHSNETPTNTLIITNLSFEANEEDLGSYFSQFSEVTEVKIARKFDGSHRGFGWVSFKDVEGAETARQRAKDEHFSPHGRRVWAHFSTKKKEEVPVRELIITNLPYSIEEAELKEFASQSGEVIRASIGRNRDGSHLGIGFVDFKNLEDAMKLRESNRIEPFHIDGRNLAINYRTRSGEKKSDTLMVRSPERMSNLDMKRIFESVTLSILSIKLVAPRAAGQEYLAYVHFDSAESASKAFEQVQANLSESEAIKFYNKRVVPSERLENHGEI